MFHDATARGRPGIARYVRAAALGVLNIINGYRAG
jgi:hypothetical protein